MKKSFLTLFTVLLLGPVAHAQDEGEIDLAETQEAASTEDSTEQTVAEATGGPKTLSGMSILGNEETPKSLVIVPWKSSELGDELDLGDTLDERAKPVDKEVFLRELNFYQIRLGEQ